MVEKRRIYAFDGIKGLSAIAVAFFYHYYMHFCVEAKVSDIPFGGENVFRYGFLAVELFFMISGFTMYQRYYNEVSHKGMSIKSFMLKRIRSLLPISSITLLVVIIGQSIYINLVGNAFIDKCFNFPHFLINVFFLQGTVFNEYSFNLPVWFVSTLLLMYLIFYIAFYTERKLGERCSLIICCFVVVIGWICMIMQLDWPLLGAEFAARGYVTFFIGVLLSRIYYNKKATILFFVFFVGIAFISIIGTKMGLPGQGKLRIFLIWIIFPLFIIISAQENALSKMLGCGFFKGIGTISNYMFFWHFPVQICIMVVLSAMNITYVPGVYLFVIYIIFVIMISCLSLYLRHCINNGRDDKK